MKLAMKLNHKRIWVAIGGKLATVTNDKNKDFFGVLLSNNAPAMMIFPHKVVLKLGKRSVRIVWDPLGNGKRLSARKEPDGRFSITSTTLIKGVDFYDSWPPPKDELAARLHDAMADTAQEDLFRAWKITQGLE